MKRLAALLIIPCLLLALILPVWAEGQGADAYFDGAVFVGDSIMQQIGRYKMEQGEKGRNILGNARFLTASSYTLYQGSRIDPANHKTAFRLGGRKVSLGDGLKKMEASKAFVLLGLNDRAGDNLKSDMLLYTRLIDRVLARNPGLALVAISVTPIAKNAQTKVLNQDNFNKFNERLKALCQEKGVLYLDMASPLMNEEGFLDLAYTSDNRVHLNDKGIQIFVDTLYTFAQSQLNP